MRTISSTIDIDAPASAVWDVLMDFESHPHWNPFIREIRGDARVGSRLRVRIGPPGRRAMTFRPRVLAATPNRELRWVGRFLAPGLFDGEHAFELTETSPTTCRLTQSETFRGLLVGFAGSTLDATAQGFDEMNHALRRRAESIAEPAG